MTISVYPGATITVSLDRHADVPEATRPKFKFAAPSLKRYMEWIDEGKVPLERLKERLISWENVTDLESGEPLEFSADNLAAAIVPSELRELLSELGVTKADRKKSE